MVRLSLRGPGYYVSQFVIAASQHTHRGLIKREACKRIPSADGGGEPGSPLPFNSRPRATLSRAPSAGQNVGWVVTGSRERTGRSPIILICGFPTGAFIRPICSDFSTVSFRPHPRHLASRRDPLTFSVQGLSWERRNS
jgi:hypothetical protein